MPLFKLDYIWVAILDVMLSPGKLFTDVTDVFLLGCGILSARILYLSEYS